MSPQARRAAALKVSEDCAWVDATRRALEGECRRMAEECERVHSKPLESIDDAVRRANAVGAKVQAEEELNCFLDDLSAFATKVPPLTRLRERYERGTADSHRRFRNRDLALAANLGQAMLVTIAGISRLDRANPPVLVLLFAAAISQTRRTIGREPRRPLFDLAPTTVVDEIFEALDEPEVRNAWMGASGSDERPGPWRASNVLVGRLTGVSWTLVRDARRAVSRTTVR